MKTFEEKWTAWLDDQLSGKELLAFEQSLPDLEVARAEKRGAQRLGSFLKQQLAAQTMSNEEFFSHQVHERIARETEDLPRTRSTWWTVPRLVWCGATALALFVLTTFVFLGQHQPGGQSDKTLKTGQEDWLANSKYFGLHVDARGENDAGYTLNLKLYKEKDVLLETDANLSRSSPLVIKGPQVGSGQLLLVLVVKDDEQTTHRRRHAQPANPIRAGWYRLRRFMHRVMP